MHSRALESSLECLREQRIAVVNEVAAPEQEAVLDVGEISGDLAHPASVWSGSNSGDLNPTRLEVDHEEDEVPNEALPRDPFDGEEVGRGNRPPMCLQEGLPTRRPPAGGIDSILREDSLIVFRPTVYPRFARAPWIRV